MLSKRVHSLLIMFLVLGLTSSTLWGQNVSRKEGPAAQQRRAEKAMETRDQALNGIQVNEPKVYDDSLLQQMLNAAQSRLMSLQMLDQSGIAARLGSITGASQSITSFGLSLQGPPLPMVATTSNGATNSTVTTGQTVATVSATPSTATTNTVQNTAAAPVTNVTTTAPSVAAPTVAAPTPSTTLPASFSVSASDILNEQMQLTYEIANLRLLLEGSLNDRVLVKDGMKMVKPRVTLGFPITLMPDKRYKNAVAVVEVEIEKNKKEDLDPSQPPALLALLPREKTYNVAAITDTSVSIGAGVVTQVASIAGSFLHGTKTYYLVQDQDTLALTFPPAVEHQIGFLWQFRPVLGAQYVKTGLKQTFVQIAFPASWSSPDFGTIHVRTYWRSYDSRHGLAGGILRGSLTEYTSTWPIPGISLAQAPKTFGPTQLEDLGNGQLLVTLKGRFLGGTYVRVGSTTLREGCLGFTSEYQQIRFVAPITDLATKQISLVARDGSESPLVFDRTQFGVGHLKIKSHTLVPVDDTNSLLTLELNQPANGQALPVILIGGRVFGYSDAPVQRRGKTLSVIVPTAFLIANPTVAVKALFTDRDYWKGAHVQLKEFTPGAQAPKLVLLEEGDDSTKFLLYGGGLDEAHVVFPAGTSLTPFGTPASPSVRLLTLTKNQIKAGKQLVLQMKDGLLLLVPIPSVEHADASKPEIKALGPVVVGADAVIFQGDGLAGLQKVVFNGIELKLKKQEDGKNVWVEGLKAAGVTAEPKAQTLEFFFANPGKTAVTINISAPEPN
jgi:hypothetical protein